MAHYGFSVPVSGAFGSVVERVIQALKGEGFGILATIDVATTLNAKLGQEMPPYLILGACNPGLAHQALAADPDIGLLLPCNVVVRQTPNGEVIVGFMDPEAVLGLVGSQQISMIGRQVRTKLEHVRDALRTVSDHPVAGAGP
ncbi:MAG: DUF302 domain-containing protein [Acidiphilium sp.]|nr:DUF302 domain-containing protein [Acidiphilium sp.]MDD4935074.1 DUF302 domain-containing protein [Acidiphilium sp.]